MTPRVSVIIPTYNRAQVIGRAIRSVFAQTFYDLEIIVVDDCSTDDIAKVVSSYFDGRIRYIRHEHNKGGSAARNTGIRAAAGEFVAFLDSDDEWLPTKLAKQMAVFEKSQCGLVYCGFIYIDESSGKRKEWLVRLAQDCRQELLVSNFVGTTSVAVVRKSLLKQTGGFDEQMRSCQDWDLYLSLRNICEFGCVEELLVNYYIDRKRKGQISTNPAAVVTGHRQIDEKYRQQIAELPRAMKIERIDYLLTIYIGMAHLRGVSLALNGFMLSGNPKYLLIILKLVVKTFARKLGFK